MKKVLTLAAAAVMCMSANAALFSFANEFSGGVNCSQPTGCATLEVTQVGANVHFKLQGTMVGTEFFTSFYGNSLGPVTAVNQTGTGLEAVDGFSYGLDSFKADGDGFFDWKFDLSSNPPRFNLGDVLEWDFIGVTLSSIIDSISVNGPAGKTGFNFALHAQGLVNGGSGWFNGGDCTNCNPPPPPPPPPPGVVPEPAPLALAGIGLVALGLVSRKKMAKA